MSPRNRKTDPFRFLGLARRAGAVALGAEAVREALRRGEVALVVIASDAAPGQAGKVERLLSHGEVPWRRMGTRAELGAALGAPPVTAVGVTGTGFATRLLEELDAEADPREGEPRALEDDQTYAG